METLQKLFAFMRTHGFHKARWDCKLTCVTEAGEEIIDNDISERMHAMFGDRHDRPLWFHV